MLEKDLLIVAAAGNTNAELDFYPASYENVLSVGWTDINDNKASAATYSYLIDLVAPGQGITSSFKDNGYSSDNGSSYASPMVAGTAALIKDVYPHLNALQIGELIRKTTDDIYGITANKTYQDKLGSGRLNMLKALTTKDVQSVRANGFEYNSPFQDHIFFGDTINIDMLFTSYLKPISNLAISFSSASTNIDFDDQPISVTFYDSMQTQNGYFKNIFIHPDTPPGTEIPIRINYSGDNYTDYQYFKIITDPNYLNIDNGKTLLSLEANGNLVSISNDNALGFIWGDEQLTSSLGFIIGNGDNKISDNAVTEVGTNKRNQDFSVVNNIRFQKHATADWVAQNAFNETANKLLIEQKTLAFNDATLDDLIIIEYRITNTTNASISGLKAGMMADWDLLDKTKNKATHDTPSGISYTSTSQNSLFAGIKIYEESTPITNSIDLKSLNGNNADIPTLIDKATKHGLISTSQFANAGAQGEGNDVAQTIAKSSFTLDAYESKKITFIIGAAFSLEALKTNISSGEKAYKDFLAAPNTLEVFPTCGVNPVELNPSSGTTFKFYNDPLGKDFIKEGQFLTVTNITKDTAFYVQNVDKKYAGDIAKVQIKIIEKNADFLLSSDTLFLGENNNKVSFTDLSTNAKNWLWDFDNGLQASTQNPAVIFQETGNYTIRLTATNNDGCISKATKTLVVAKRPTAPNIPDQTICQGSNVILDKNSAESIAVYLEKESTEWTFKGSSFSSDPLQHDTTFYVSSFTEGFESERKEVKVNIALSNLQLHQIIDTLSFENRILIFPSEKIKNQEWMVDGVSVSTADTLILTVVKNNYQIQLNAESNEGCSLTVSKNLAFSKSKTPTAQSTTVCKNTPLTIKPSNGSIFGFYAKSDLSDLLHKGKSLNLSSVSSDTSIYIVGLDSGFPSDTKTIKISVSQSNFSIIATPAILNLNNEKNARFTNNLTSLTDQQWYLNGEPISALKEITLLFTKVDTVVISVQGVDQYGCSLFSSINYSIISQKEIDNPLSLKGSPQFSVYPNPTSGIINISGVYQGDFVEMLDLTGNVVLRKKITTENPSFDLSSLQKGVYLFKISHQLTPLFITYNLIILQ